jgi:AcrR family transcriptional regulator
VLAVAGLPEAPPNSLDPYLDAAVRCFVRFGVSRTSVQDVAAEMKVNRATVYRQVGNTENILRLVVARAIRKIVTGALDRSDPGDVSANAVVDALSAVIDQVRHDPVISKILGDEMDFVGGFLDDLASIFDRVASAISPSLRSAMRAGKLAKRDPVVIAQWLTRLSATCIVSPPPGDLRSFLAEVILPVLTPPTAYPRGTDSSGRRRSVAALSRS